MPAHGSSIGAKIEGVDDTDLSQGSTPSTTGLYTPTPLFPALPEPIPGYEIQGDLGHGGMGVVYRARSSWDGPIRLWEAPLDISVAIPPEADLAFEPGN